MVSKQEQEKKLQLIPKTEKYIEYMLQIIFKLPRTEKFSIGTEYKQSLYQTLENIMMISKTAKEILVKIKKFLKENLELELNKKTQIFKNKQGVNFCGYKINEYRMKIRDKGKRKLKKKVKYLKYEIKNGKLNSKEAKKYLAGHLGYIKYANVNNLLEKIFYIEK